MGRICCFLDKDKPGKTFGRAYLISRAQYEHVKKCEGHLYTKEVKLGEIEGMDSVTFTNQFRFKPNSNVSESYKHVILCGLQEMGIDSENAKKYLDDRIKSCY